MGEFRRGTALLSPVRPSLPLQDLPASTARPFCSALCHAGNPQRSRAWESVDGSMEVKKGYKGGSENKLFGISPIGDWFNKS